MFSPSAYMETFGEWDRRCNCYVDSLVTIRHGTCHVISFQPTKKMIKVKVIGQKDNFNGCINVWCWCSEEIAIPKRQACPRVLLRFKWGNHLSHWESLGKGWWGWWTRILVHKILNLNLSPHATDLAWHLWPVLGWRYGGLDEGDDSKCVERSIDDRWWW